MSSEIRGPGMLWVNSRIAQSSKDLLDEFTFLKWYDEDHIPEIVATSGCPNAFRYVDVEKGSALGSAKAPKPFLAFYPMDEMAFTQGEEFKKIRVKSDILPGSGIVFDLADMDVSYFGFVGKAGNRKSKEAVPYILVSAIEPAAGTSDDEVNKFYDQQTATVSESPNYLRTLRFKLQYARTNAQSRALKGLPTTDEPNPEPPTWQAVHEFSAEPSSEVKSSVQSDSSEVLKKAKQNRVNAYKHAITQGKGECFD